MYDNERPEPLDRTTERIVNELVARIVPELVRALNASPAVGTETAEATAAVRAEMAHLADSLKAASVEEAERRLTLTNSLVAAFDELSSLREFCEGLARSLEASGGYGPSEEIREALARIERAQAARAQDGAAGRGLLERFDRMVREATEENRVGRQALLQPIGSIVEELSSLRGQLGNMADSLRALRSQEEALQKVRDSVEQLREGWGRAEARQDALDREIAALGGRLETRAPNSSQPAPEGRLAQLVEASLPNWEGLLRAHNQAQTRELESLSKELSDLQTQGSATLLLKLQDAVEQEIAGRDAEWEMRLRAERAEVERRLRPLHRVLWVLAGVGMLSLIIAIAGLIR